MKNVLRAAAIGTLLTLSLGQAESKDTKPQQPDAVQAMSRKVLEKETQELRARVKLLLQRLETANGKKVLEDGCPIDCKCNRCCGNGLIISM